MLRVLRTGPAVPQVAPRPDHVLAALRLQRALPAAVLARRGRARQAVAAVEDARRRLAEARDAADAARLHVRAPGPQAAVHGRRDRPVARVEPRRRARLGGARRSAPRRPAALGPRPATPPIAPAAPLWAEDFAPEGFAWIDCHDHDNSVVSLLRRDPAQRRAGGRGRQLHAERRGPAYRIGVPIPGTWRERLNSDADVYGGSNTGNGGRLETEPVARHGHAQSLVLTIPPLGFLLLEPEPAEPRRVSPVPGPRSPVPSYGTPRAGTRRVLHDLERRATAALQSGPTAHAADGVQRLVSDESALIRDEALSRTARAASRDA